MVVEEEAVEEEAGRRETRENSAIKKTWAAKVVNRHFPSKGIKVLGDGVETRTHIRIMRGLIGRTKAILMRKKK